MSIGRKGGIRKKKQKGRGSSFFRPRRWKIGRGSSLFRFRRSKKAGAGSSFRSREIEEHLPIFKEPPPIFKEVAPLPSFVRSSDRSLRPKIEDCRWEIIHLRGRRSKMEPVEPKTRTYVVRAGRGGAAHGGRRGGAGPGRTGRRRVGSPRRQPSLMPYSKREPSLLPSKTPRASKTTVLNVLRKHEQTKSYVNRWRNTTTD